jgi:hypothetical protein
MMLSSDVWLRSISSGLGLDLGSRQSVAPVNKGLWIFVKSSDLSINMRLATEQDPVEKEAKTDAELEDMILQRLLIGGVFVSVRRDQILGWRPTVVTAPKHARNAQELADKIAADLRKKFTLKE